MLTIRSFTATCPAGCRFLTSRMEGSLPPMRGCLGEDRHGSCSPAARREVARQIHALPVAQRLRQPSSPAWMLCTFVGVVVAGIAFKLFGALGIRAVLEASADRRSLHRLDGDLPRLAGPLRVLRCVPLDPLRLRLSQGIRTSPRTVGRDHRPGHRRRVPGSPDSWSSSRLSALPRTDDAIVTANTIKVIPEVAGRIATLNVKDDATVHKGDVLFTIESERYQLNLAQARAQVQALEAQIDSTDRAVSVPGDRDSAARAHAESARARVKEATETLQRMEPLRGAGLRHRASDRSGQGRPGPRRRVSWPPHCRRRVRPRRPWATSKRWPRSCWAQERWWGRRSAICGTRWCAPPSTGASSG